MASAPRQMHLGMFLQGAGHHVAGWRYPDAEFRQREPTASGAAGGDRRARQVRHGVPRRRPDQQRGRPSLADRPLRAADGADGICARDQPDRARRHVLDDLRRAVPSRARLRLARSHQPWPRRLERGDHVLRLDRRELRDQASRTRRPLRHRRGVHRRGARAVELVGRRCLSEGQDDGRLCRPVEAPCARPQGHLFLREGAAQHLAAAAGPPDHRAVRLVGARPAARGADRRCGVHRASEPRQRAGVLSRT